MKCWFICFLMIASPVMADSSLSKQLDEFQAARLVEIQQRDQQYIAKLKLLFERAQRVGDIEAKSRVQAELERITAIVQTTAAAKPLPGKIATAEDLAAVLISAPRAEWLQGDGVVFGSFRFLPGGKLELPGSMYWLRKWEATDKDEFRIYHQDGFYWLFKFSEEKEFAKSVKKRGAAQDDSKAVRLMGK